MNYEIAEFMLLAEANGSAETHNQYSVWEMQVMDEARRQMGIVFPADQSIRVYRYNIGRGIEYDSKTISGRSDWDKLLFIDQ